MNASRTAHADQLHAELRDARCCDALAPCDDCRAKAAEVRAIRHAERVAALTVYPSFAMLRERLAVARVSA